MKRRQEFYVSAVLVVTSGYGPLPAWHDCVLMIWSNGSQGSTRTPCDVRTWTTSPVFCIQHYPTVFVGRKSLIFTLILPKYVFNFQINNKLTMMACQRHITYQTILTHLNYACEPVLHHEVPRILLLLFIFKRSFKSRRFHFTFPAAKEENQSISVPTREMIRITFVNHCNSF